MAGMPRRLCTGAGRAYHEGVKTTASTYDEALKRLVDDYRGRCLWFVREGYYPETREEVLRVLDAIQRYGDVEAFRRAGELRRWVSPPSSATSAGS
jgi:hypothetical protein